MAWIGVMLNRTILRKGVRGKPVFEKLGLYAKAARELGVDVIFFDPGGVKFKTGRVVGYAPAGDGRFARASAPIPAVVHKRGIFRRPSESRVVKRLEKSGVFVFNPEITLDKYTIHRLLHGRPELRPHLPDTVLLRRGAFPWFKERLAAGGEVFVKPRRGSLGIGVARVVRIGPNRYRYESMRRRKTTSLRGAWRLVRNGRRSHILQSGVPLLKEGGRRVDLRVPVQRDGSGLWRTAGITAKRAEKHAFLTNLARGGSAHDGRALLLKHFGAREGSAVIEAIERLALLVAETLGDRHPRLADLGLDIGVDEKGHPYLIEVNRRDLRILFERSGQREAYELLYKNPIAYARSILEGRLTESRPLESRSRAEAAV